jgi:hypothetical protein
VPADDLSARSPEHLMRAKLINAGFAPLQTNYLHLRFLSCVGAALDLLRNGHNTTAIMHAGGWKSLEVLARYLEFAEHNVWEVPA